MFKELMNLQNLSEAFYFSDQDITVKGKEYTIRSFSYRLATCTDFQLPFAKESRGTAYYTEKGKEDWKLFSRSFPKFFNLGECIEKSEYISKYKPLKSFEKLDGSLITAGVIQDEIVMKSKTSINSDQAKLSQTLINNNKTYQKYIKEVQSKGYTSVFELIGQKNVIVIRYDVEAELVLLGLINNRDGHIIKYIHQVPFRTPKMYSYSWSELLNIQETSTPDIEGFVTYTDNGMVKVKCKSYCELHKLKDLVNNEKTLAELILSDNLDDLIGLFQDDPKTIEYITQAQERVSKKYNHLVKTVEDIYERTKSLDRKDFAISNKSNKYFGLIMHMYLGKEVKFKEYFMKNKMYEN